MSAQHRFNNDLRYRDNDHEMQRQLTPSYVLEPVRQALDGLQELGRALGLPLGEQITGPRAVEAARALRARAETRVLPPGEGRA